MNGKIVLSVKAGDMMKPPPSAAWFTQPVVEWTRLASNEFEPIVVEKQQKQSLIDTKLRLQTSFKPQLVTKDIEARIPLLCQFIEENFKDRPVKAGRFGLKTRQFAEVLLSMYLLKTNEDGSNPVARYEAFITELYKAGVFHYSYNAHRLKAVKDYLSSKGCIDWKDNSYCFGTHQASKWSLCNELVQKMAMVLSPVEQHTQSLIDTSITVDFELCTGQNLQAVYRSKIYASCVYHTDGVSWTPEDLPSLAA
jgi:hypothetical protein